MNRSARAVKPPVSISGGSARNEHKPPVISARKIAMNGILAALEQGPATMRDCIARMGFVYVKANEMTTLAYVLEQRGLVERVGRDKAKFRGPRAIIWALVSEKST